MSVIITVERGSEKFDVEVFHNGQIDLTNNDLQYWQAYEEFYGTNTNAVRFYKLWKKNHMAAIADSLWVVDKPFLLFMVDCAEHTIPIYKSKYSLISSPYRVLDIVRIVAANGLPIVEFGLANNYLSLLNELLVLEQSISKFASKHWQDRDISTSLYAIAEVADTSQPVWICNNPADSDIVGDFLFASDTAARSVGFRASSDNESTKWKRAYKKEVAWQVRRFVDVMEAIGQGLPWPPLEATP